STGCKTFLQEFSPYQNQIYSNLGASSNRLLGEDIALHAKYSSKVSHIPAIKTASATEGNTETSEAKSGGIRGKLNKVVLAYSGGLDTSVIVPWLRENYDCEVVCFTADVGQ
ncbi:hypothetical protein KI387_022532, partial [Taxus chinensis]